MGFIDRRPSPACLINHFALGRSIGLFYLILNMAFVGRELPWMGTRSRPRRFDTPARPPAIAPAATQPPAIRGQGRSPLALMRSGRSAYLSLAMFERSSRANRRRGVSPASS